jgi:DNA (cytosine-5)-methyltransferase 1
VNKTHKKGNYFTVRDFIGNLEPIKDGEKSSKDPIHCSRKLSEINKIRIRNTPEGGGWKDWESSLLLECHKKKSGKTYSAVYGRMKWDDISPTITTEFLTYGCGRYGHPEQNRAISLREGSLLQTFPKDYKLLDPSKKFSSPNLSRHIGNAVPVQLGQIIAKSIKEHIKCY